MHNGIRLWMERRGVDGRRSLVQQETLASRARVSVQSIIDWEAGRSDLSDSQLQDLIVLIREIRREREGVAA